MKISNKVKINKSFINTIDYQNGIKQYWDIQISGFGVTVNKKSAIYMYKYRNKYGKSQTLKIANVNTIPAEEARKRVQEICGDIVKGADPAKQKKEFKQCKTISNLCDEYLTNGCSHKKESTIKGDKGRIETIIKPLVGNKILEEFSFKDANDMMNNIINGEKIKKREKTNKPRGLSNVSGGKGAAKRTMDTFGAIMTYAVKCGYISQNPVQGIKKPKIESRKIYLTETEIKSLGKIFRAQLPTTSMNQYIDILTVLLLTGCRKSEILQLTWDEVNFEEQCIDFNDTKTGKQTRVVGKIVMNILKRIYPTRTSNYVFPAEKSNFHPDIRKKLLSLLQTRENGLLILEKHGLSPHSFRHTFASYASKLKFQEQIIGKLLGHKQRTITSIYNHIEHEDLVAAADQISESLYGLLHKCN